MCFINRTQLWSFTLFFCRVREQQLTSQMGTRILFPITITLIVVVNQQVGATSNTCISQECVHAVSQTIDNSDDSADPCEDFYQLASGKFLKNAHGNESRSLLHKLEDPSGYKLYEIYQEEICEDEDKTLNRLFKTYMNDTQIKADFVNTVNKTLKAVGGWPVVEGSSWNEETFDWLNATYQLRRLGYHYSAFLTLDVVPDPDNEDKYILKVLPSLERDNMHTDLSTILLMATLFGAKGSQNLINELGDSYNTFKDIQQVYLVANFFQLFSKYPGYAKQTIEEIQKSDGVIDWLEFINNIVGPKVQLTKNDYILFPKGEYLKRLIDLMSKTSKRNQANYMMWKVIEPVVQFLRDRAYNPFICSDPPEGVILDRLITLVPNPIEVIQHRRHLSEQRKQKAKELVVKIKSEFAKAVSKADWIPEEAKQKYVDKIKEVEVVVEMSGNYFEDEMLEEGDVDMVDNRDNASFFTLLAQANKNHQTAKYAKLKIAHKSTPFYDSTSNLLYVPLSATEDFVLDENRPEYLNYGELGTLVASQLSNIVVSLVHTDDFQKTNQCSFLQECNANEILTTSIGQQVSYAAYKEWIKHNGEETKLNGTDYTPNQLFWISAASVMSESKRNRIYTVYEALRLNSNFIQDFNCPANSQFNLSNNCKIF